MNKYNEVEIQTAKNLLKQGYKWLARTFQGSVGAFSCKPCKKGGCWFYPSNLACTTGKTVTVSGKFTPLFQSIKWEDNEPTYIEDIINPQILDDAEKQEVNRMDDLISRQAAIAHAVPLNLFGREIMMVSVSELENLPSAQPEPLSDAYTKAVWTWLLDYQIKAAKLKGRYTPYEVLSWVVNDWRKEHEGSD